MKRALIVDDSEYKIRDIIEVLREIRPNLNIETAKAFNPAVTRLIQVQPELVLLDMSIPTFVPSTGDLGGRMRPFGGRDLLREITDMNLKTRVIVITQFDRFGEAGKYKAREELMEELKLEFPEYFVDGLYYDVADGSWRSKLRDAIIKAGL